MWLQLISSVCEEYLPEVKTTKENKMTKVLLTSGIGAHITQVVWWHSLLTESNTLTVLPC